MTKYTAKAVRFDSAWLCRSLPLIGVVDSRSGIHSCWLNISNEVGQHFTSWSQTGSITGGLPDASDVHCQTGPNVVGPNSAFPLFLTNSDFSSEVAVYPDIGIFDGTWHNIIFSWNLPTIQIAVDGVLRTTSIYFANGSSTFNVSGSVVGTTIWGETPSGFSTPGDVSEFYLNFGQAIDLSVKSNVEKFIKRGNPVDLGNDGSIPTGTAPAIFFSGDASSFPVNRGTGGLFDIIGTLTNATTHP